MSIVLSFEMNKTYGTQNEDLAKKNKYTAVQISKDVVTANSEESQHDYIAETTQTPTSTDNAYKDVVGTDWTGQYRVDIVALYNKVYSAVIQLYYKSYSVTLDLSQPEYANLVTVTSAPVFDWAFSGTKYEEVYNKSKADEEFSGTITKNSTQWNAFMNSPISRDPFGLLSGHSGVCTPETFTVTDNLYTRDTEEQSALQDILANIQNAYNTTKSGNLEKFYDYVKPVITGWYNNGTTITFNLRMPYQLKSYDSQWVYRESDDEYTLGGYSTKKILTDWSTKWWATYNYYEYNFSSIKIQFYNKYEITGTNEVMYYDGNRIYRPENSFLFADGNKYNLGNFQRKEYSQKFAEEVYENFKNGKTSLDIKYPLGPMYDDMGNQLFFIKDVGIVRKIGDKYLNDDGEAIEPADESDVSEHIFPEEGMKCIITNNGVPLTTNGIANNIQYYYVQNANLSYSGITLNELTLAESNTEPEDYILMYDDPEHGTLDIRDGANNRLYSGSRIEKDTTIYITLTTDTHYGLIDSKIYINGQSVTPTSGNNYWRVTVKSNIKVEAPVVYLGGKYLHLNIDSDDITMKSGLYNEKEIYTGDLLEIAGNVSSGLTPLFTIDGEEQAVTSSGSYDFYKMITVGNSDVYVSVKTTSLARTVTVTFDDDEAPASLSQPFYKIYSSDRNPLSANTDVYNNGTVYIGDKVQQYLVTYNTGYSQTSVSRTGLEDIGGQLLKVVDNVSLTYETSFSQISSVLRIFRNAITFNSSKYNGYNITVNRTESKSGAPTGEITPFSGQLNGVPFTGYNIYVGDTIQFTIRMIDGITGEYVTAETTITATPTSGSTISFSNGESFLSKEIDYSITATYIS